LKEGTVRIEHDPLLVDPKRLGKRTDTTVTDAFSDILTGGQARLNDGRYVQSRGAVYVGTQLPKLALKGAESDADVETAAFLDVANSGDNTAFGGGAFYEYSDVLDHYENG
jgi:hypothetical protein